MNKTLTRKLIYVVAALAMLAMLIPAMAVPVSAAPANLSMVLVDPITGIAGTTPDSGYNIMGSIVQVTSDQAVTWSLNPPPTSGIAQILTGSTANAVRVQGTLGNVLIQGTNSGNETASIGKKFGLIDHTTLTITPPGSSTYVTWNEQAKAWQAGPIVITDTVTGLFDASPATNPMQGVILNWYLLPGNMALNLSAQEFLNHGSPVVQGLKARFDAYLACNGVHQVSFANGSQLSYYQNVTNAAGQNSISLYAKGEEAVQVVVIPEYPGDPQIFITPEIISYNFYTTEAEVVPQVRWAGEKIVLEKYFGPTYNGKDVCFSLQNGSIGSLEGISANESYSNSAWTTIQNGFASCILVSSDAGVANVVAGLYEANQGVSLGNQHFFTVYFLKFESVTIGDVQGKRVGHNWGLWEIDTTLHTTNPWDVSTDSPTQTLNVSQDALVRARVKGWFTSNNPSVRVVRTVDPANSTLSNPGSATLTLPAGRWVLPDDWATLAGPNWQQSRIHWDIMCNPDGIKTSTNWVGSGLTGDELGNYYKYALAVQSTTMVGNDDVIGPFSPGLELMTPAGWEIVNAPTWDATYRNMHTVVPNGLLNMWDAPMPPAKIIYQIQDAGANPNKDEMGYFKAANKTDIYYTWVPDPNLNNPAPIKVYTNPFYQEMIPAHQAIPAFINNGGYDWNSFQESYGAYMFWEFINQNRYLPIVTTADPAGHPTCVEVYSDNHGEAMVWLNGNWNLYMGGNPNYLNKGANDVPYEAIVGHTSIQATADYPYSRLHQAFQSNTDTKTWLWGGLILGSDEHLYANGDSSQTDETRMVISAGTWVGYPNGKTGTYPNENAISKDQVVWVWVSDRDGKAAGVLGNTVEWIVSNSSGSAARISTRTCNDPNDGISQYNEVTKNIFLTNGFLTGTLGSITDGASRLHALSTLRLPTAVEKVLFNKFWGYGYKDPITHVLTSNATSTLNGLNPDNFCVAAIDLEDLIGVNAYSRCSVTANIYGNDFNPLYPAAPSVVLPVPSDKYVQYITNINFAVAQPLDDAIRAGDANCDGVVNMGDVTAVERMILGYTTTAQNAVLNSDGTVDMGTVVKIERTILGLK